MTNWARKPYLVRKMKLDSLDICLTECSRPGGCCRLAITAITDCALLLRLAPTIDIDPQLYNRVSALLPMFGPRGRLLYYEPANIGNSTGSVKEVTLRGLKAGIECNLAHAMGFNCDKYKPDQVCPFLEGDLGV